MNHPMMELSRASGHLSIHTPDLMIMPRAMPSEYTQRVQQLLSGAPALQLLAIDTMSTPNG